MAVQSLDSHMENKEWAKQITAMRAWDFIEGEPNFVLHLTRRPSFDNTFDYRDVKVLVGSVDGVCYNVEEGQTDLVLKVAEMLGWRDK